MTGHKNRLSNHRFITFYHVPCPHVLMSFSSQCLQDHGRPGRILLDGEVYKCSLVGQLSKSRHCHSFKHFGCVVMQTVWNPICFFFYVFFRSVMFNAGTKLSFPSEQSFKVDHCPTSSVPHAAVWGTGWLTDHLKCSFQTLGSRDQGPMQVISSNEVMAWKQSLVASEITTITDMVQCAKP